MCCLCTGKVIARRAAISHARECQLDNTSLAARASLTVREGNPGHIEFAFMFFAHLVMDVKLD